MDHKLCVPCLLGLEGPIAEELRRMDMDGVSAENGRVFFPGGDEAIARAFSSSLQFYTVETQHCADRCVFCIRDADFGPDTAVQRRTEYVKGSFRGPGPFPGRASSPPTGPSPSRATASTPNSSPFPTVRK